MKPDDAGPSIGFEGLKVSWGTGTLIVLLTLAVWIFFWMERMPLDAASTGVVALAVTIFVMLGRWVRSRLRRSAPAK